MDPLSLIRTIYSISNGIYSQVKQVQINQEQCKVLAGRVQVVE